MAGLALISVGVIAWLGVQSLVITLASTYPPQDAWMAVYAIRTSLLLTGGVAVGLGILLFAVSVLIDTRGIVFTILTWLAVLAGLVGMAEWLVAIFNTDAMDSATAVARGMYIIYVVWLITLGIRLAKEEEREET